MANLSSPTSGHIDVALSNYAREIRNNALITDTLFPRVPVDKQSNKYWIEGEEGLELALKVLRAPLSAAEEVIQTLSTDSYFADDHALSRLVSDEETGNADRGNTEQRATNLVTRKVLLDKEQAAVTLATDAAQYAASNKVTLSGAAQWSVKATADPIGDVETAKQQIGLIGEVADLMILSPEQAASLAVADQIVNRFVNTQPGPVSISNLASVFGIPNIMIARGVKKVSGTKQYIWPDSAFIGHLSQASSMQDASFAKTFVWDTAPGTVGGFKVQISRLVPESRSGDSVDVHFYYAQKITFAEAGYLIIDTEA